MDQVIRGTIVVDSSVWVDYYRDIRNPQTDWLDRAMDRRRLGTLDLVLCEVLQGIPVEAEFQRAKQELLRFDFHECTGQEIAVEAARNFRLLRSRGITIRKTIDCIIATYCIENGYTLLHNDRDFDPFEVHLGLQVVHPSRTLPSIQ